MAVSAPPARRRRIGATATARRRSLPRPPSPERSGQPVGLYRCSPLRFVDAAKMVSKTLMRRLDAGTRHRSNRPPASSSKAPSALTGEIGAAGPLPAGTPVGKEGWVSVVVCSVMVIAAPGPVVKMPAVEVVVGPVGVVSRARVLGVVFSFGGRGTVRLALVRVGGCTGMLLGLVFSFGGRGTVRLALVRVGGCTGMLLGLVFSFGGGVTGRLVLVRVLVPGVPVGPEPGAVEVPVGPPAVLVAGVLLLLLLPEGWAQSGVLMVLLSRVTAAVCASRRPVTVAPVCAVTDARASTVPTKVE